MPVNRPPPILERRTNVLTPAELDKLRAATFVAQAEWHAELPSTNDRALALAARDDLKLPLLILTEQQTAGRGRGANRWWGGHGSLTFSLLLDAHALGIDEPRWPQVSLIVGLSVCETLQELLPLADVRVKWPNDVTLQGRKVCGILVEVPPRLPGRLVIGIGININNSLADAPPELRATATSLIDISGQPHPRVDVLISMLRRFEVLLDAWSRDSLSLPQRWENVCWLKGRRVQLTAATRELSGLCHGIDEQGALLIETSTGLHRAVAGTVRPLD